MEAEKLTTSNPLAEKIIKFYMEDPEAFKSFMSKMVITPDSSRYVGEKFGWFLADRFKAISNYRVRDPWCVLEFAFDMFSQLDEETQTAVGARIIEHYQSGEKKKGRTPQSHS